MPKAAATPSAEPDDAQNVTRIVVTQQAAVWRYLRVLGCAPDAADDLTQETFVVALRRGFRHQSTVQTAVFLRRTARHLWLRTQRDSRRRATLLAAAAETIWQRDCADDAGARWLDALRECVAELGDRARECVRAFYGEAQPRATVARRLGMKETGVKTLLQRTRQALRGCVHRRLT